LVKLRCKKMPVTERAKLCVIISGMNIEGILISLTRELRSATVTAAKRINGVKRMAALWKRFIYYKTCMVYIR